MKKTLPGAHVAHRAVAEAAERRGDRLALRVEHAFPGIDPDLHFHASNASKPCDLVRDLEGHVPARALERLARARRARARGVLLVRERCVATTRRSLGPAARSIALGRLARSRGARARPRSASSAARCTGPSRSMSSSWFISTQQRRRLAQEVHEVLLGAAEVRRDDEARVVGLERVGDGLGGVVRRREGAEAERRRPGRRAPGSTRTNGVKRSPSRPIAVGRADGRVDGTVPARARRRGRRSSGRCARASGRAAAIDLGRDARARPCAARSRVPRGRRRRGPASARTRRRRRCRRSRTRGR